MIQEQFAALVADHWEANLRNDPLAATAAGDHRYDDRLPAVREDDVQSWLESLRGYRRRAGQIDPAALPAAERLNYDIFCRMLDDEIGELQYCAHRLPISRTGGFHTYLPDTLPVVMPFDTIQGYENYLARLAAVGRFVEQQIGVMRLGLVTGYLPPRATLAGLDEALRKQIVARAEDSPFFEPFTRLPAALAGAQGERLAAAGRAAILGTVVPAYRELLRFLEEEYRPAARDSIGACHLPDGEAFYRHRIRRFTSLKLTPAEIHQTGRAEVARIRAEMEDLAASLGFGRDVAALVEHLRTDPHFYAGTPEMLLRETAYVLKRIDGELPRLFKTLPRTPYGIRPIPAASAEGNTTAYYFPPAGDGRTAGFYYVNTSDLPSRPLYEIEALSLHEAVPGHHLQIALQQELHIPNFRRFLWFAEFGEGWALYAERLGLEVGFYQDPTSNFGRLSYEMWRACRLVVDTGMHALGWTRQQAIDMMAANTSSTLLNIANEVDRYIAWPGQALAYKIGELKIRELRARAETALGPQFDLREFHDILLGNGCVPLDLLERIVEGWIARVKGE